MAEQQERENIQAEKSQLEKDDIMNDVESFDFPLNGTQIMELVFNYKTPEEIKKVVYP